MKKSNLEKISAQKLSVNSDFSIKMVILATLGGALEFFDFTLFAIYAPYIAQAFFPSSNPIISVLKSFTVFSIGYLARPLGGIIFGHFGDRYGRKSMFIVATLLMSLATLFIACIPPYSVIGIWAAYLVVIFRLLQGISVGGELAGAAIFVAEYLPSHRGKAVGFIFSGITFGNVLATSLAMGLNHMLSQAAMIAWGWRIPFFLGAALALVSYQLRRRFLETPRFLLLHTRCRLPLWDTLRKHLGTLIMAIGLMGVPAAGVFVLLFLPSYLRYLNYAVSDTYFYSCIGFVCLAFSTALFGWLSDYFGRKRLLLFGSILLALASHLLFSTIHYSVIIFVLCFTAIMGMVNGVYIISIIESFPTSVRYTAVAFSYNLGFALINGIGTLLMAHYLDSSLQFLDCFIILTSLITTISGLFLTDRHHSTMLK